MRPGETGPPLGQLLCLPASPEEEHDTPRIVIAISIACTGLQAHPLDTTEYYTTRSLPWSMQAMPEISDDLPVYADKYPDDLPVNSPPEYKVGYKQPPRSTSSKKTNQATPADGRKRGRTFGRICTKISIVKCRNRCKVVANE